jgi:hypothetical protein
MNKTDIIAIAVRLLSEKSTLIPKPDPFTETINSLFGIESYDKRIARGIEADVEKLAAATKRAIINHKFKKITQNV